MPSISEALSPASSMALRTAVVASARVVLFEPRVWGVSPTPMMAYLSRRNFGVVASTSSLGSGISSKLPIGFFFAAVLALYWRCCIDSKGPPLFWRPPIRLGASHDMVEEGNVPDEISKCTRSRQDFRAWQMAAWL